MKLILDTPTHKIAVPDGAIVNPPIIIRTITTQAFYRRMTKTERNVLRASNNDDVKDLREDLGRSDTVNLDGSIRQQLFEISVFDQTRIDELLVDGAATEV